MKRRRGQTTKRKSAKKRELGRYKSGLEKTCADLLAESGIPFSYEEHEYTLMDKFRYEGVLEDDLKEERHDRSEQQCCTPDTLQARLRCEGRELDHRDEGFPSFSPRLPDALEVVYEILNRTWKTATHAVHL